MSAAENHAADHQNNIHQKITQQISRIMLLIKHAADHQNNVHQKIMQQIIRIMFIKKACSRSSEQCSSKKHAVDHQNNVH